MCKCNVHQAKVEHGSCWTKSNDSYWEFNRYSPLFNGVLRYSILEHFGSGLNDKTVIDFGCGMGQLVRQCLTIGSRSVVGVDVNQELINKAKIQTVQDGWAPFQYEYRTSDCFQVINVL